MDSYSIRCPSGRISPNFDVTRTNDCIFWWPGSTICGSVHGSLLRQPPSKLTDVTPPSKSMERVQRLFPANGKISVTTDTPRAGSFAPTPSQEGAVVAVIRLEKRRGEEFRRYGSGPANRPGVVSGVLFYVLVEVGGAPNDQSPYREIDCQKRDDFHRLFLLRYSQIGVLVGPRLASPSALVSARAKLAFPAGFKKRAITSRRPWEKKIAVRCRIPRARCVRAAPRADLASIGGRGRDD